MRRLRRAFAIAVWSVLAVAALLAIVNAASYWVLTSRRSAARESDAYFSAELTTAYDPDYRRQIIADMRASRTEYAPFVAWRRLPYDGDTLHVDAHGDRVVPQIRAPAPTARQVRFFGGSTLWGVGADDAGTIPAWFAQLNPECTVLNHGEQGFNSRQNLERLISLLSRGERIDIVLFYVGVNDVDWLILDQRDVPGHSLATNMREAIRTRKRDVVLRALELVFVESIQRLSRELRGGSAHEAPARTWYEENDVPERIDQINTVLWETWDIARHLVEARGGRFALLLQPIAFVGAPRIDHLAGTFVAGQREFTVKLYEVIRSQARARGMHWFHDLTSALDSETERFYFDWCHVTELGNRRIAERIHALDLRAAQPAARK